MLVMELSQLEKERQQQKGIIFTFPGEGYQIT